MLFKERKQIFLLSRFAERLISCAEVDQKYPTLECSMTRPGFALGVPFNLEKISRRVKGLRRWKYRAWRNCSVLPGISQAA